MLNFVSTEFEDFQEQEEELAGIAELIGIYFDGLNFIVLYVFLQCKDNFGGLFLIF